MRRGKGTDRHGADDDDDKYKKGGGKKVSLTATPTSFSSPSGGPSNTRSLPVTPARDEDDKPTGFKGFGSDKSSEKSAGRAAAGLAADMDSSRARGKLDFNSGAQASSSTAAPSSLPYSADKAKHALDKLNFDADRIKNKLDQLNFEVKKKDVFNAVTHTMTDAQDELGQALHKGTDVYYMLQANKYASRWTPNIEQFGIKPTYIKVPVETVQKIKFYEDKSLSKVIMEHTREMDSVVGENQGLREMLRSYIKDLDPTSETVASYRESQDGVNRALLLSAMEEIARLKARESALEQEMSSLRLESRGFGLSSGSGSGAGAGDAFGKLKKECERLEEDNSRLTWLVDAKEKQVQETKKMYSSSRAHDLEEQLQDLCYSLSETVEGHGKIMDLLREGVDSKLEQMQEQVDDLSYSVEIKKAQWVHLQKAIIKYLSTGDETIVSVLVSLLGLEQDDKLTMTKEYETLRARTIYVPQAMAGIYGGVTGAVGAGVGAVGGVIGGALGGLMNRGQGGGAPYTPVSGGAPAGQGEEKAAEGDESDGGASEAGEDEDEDAAGAQGEGDEAAAESAPGSPEAAAAAADPTKSQDPAPAQVEKAYRPPPRSRPRPKDKKEDAGFAGFDDPEAEARERREREKKPQDAKLAELRNQVKEQNKALGRKVRGEEQPDPDGFAGFDADSDEEDI